MSANQDIAKILFEMSELLAMQDVQFKPRAYEKTSETIREMSPDLRDIYKEKGAKGFLEIPGIGKGIADKIEEYLKTGPIRKY